jgi:thymidylate synthase (FAD)
MQVLDHGYVNYVEHWGSDERIVEAARMSTGKGFLGWDPGPCPLCAGGVFAVCGGCEGKGKIVGDSKLLAYLYNNKHSTPFEMAGLVIEVQAPIFVFREWHRHRTQSYNEMSARYVPLPNLNYIPTVERLMVNAGGTNKQAGTVTGADVLTEELAGTFRVELTDMYQRQEKLYQQALIAGVPKELARIHLPVGRYSRMRASANLRNWLAFLTLRSAPGAQYEIRQYAHVVGTIISQYFERTWELFAKEREKTTSP